MSCELCPETPSPEARSTLSLAIVGRNANIVARTAAFDAAVQSAAPEGWSDDVLALVRKLIAELDRAPSSSAMLSDGRRVRVFPLLGLIATYAVSIERERPAISVDAIAKRFPLSVRESEVIRLLVCGATNSEIARTLGIGETTVVSHVRNIGIKLGCSKRLTMVARILGLPQKAATTSR